MNIYLLRVIHSDTGLDDAIPYTLRTIAVAQADIEVIKLQQKEDQEWSVSVEHWAGTGRMFCKKTIYRRVGLRS